MNSKERVYSRLKGDKVDRAPNLNIVMGFAAKYIGRTYLDYVTDFRVLVEGNMRCCEDFGIDMVSAISDPTREIHDLGGEVVFPLNEAPYCSRPPVETVRDLRSLKIVEPSRGKRMGDRISAVELYSETAQSDYPILGWVEGPLALAASLRGPVRLMEDFFDASDFVCELLEFSLEQETLFARAQIDAGADFIGIGDAVCSLIGPKFYSKFGLPYEKRLIENITSTGAKVKLHICGDTTAILPMMVTSGASIVDIDWMVDFAYGVRTGTGKSAICGNFDPVSVMLKGTPERVAASVKKCLAVAQETTFIAAGCEIPADTPLDNMRQMNRTLSSAD